MSYPLKNAADFGFLPQNTAEENTLALQNAVRGGGTVAVGTAGTYEISGTVLLDSHTVLVFGAGVVLRRVAPKAGSCAYLFINRGAYTRVDDTDITIESLHLLCNGNEAMGDSSGLPPREDGWENEGDHIEGLRGHISFFHCNNVTVRGFVCPDLGRTSYAVQICAFRNFLFENARIEGKKDGVHLGHGKDFVIRHCLFCTYDDPIALNAYDYTTGCPEVGFIENGMIEDCYDLNADTTDGFFCRILGGAWRDFRSGMTLRHSDTVVSNGRVYRVLMKPDGREYTAVTPPTHERGKMTLDGICYIMCQEGAVYNCACRNIRFCDIYLQKRRRVAFSVHFDNDAWCHGCYPHAKMAENENILLENIHMQNEVAMLVHANAPMDTLKIVNSDLRDTQIVLSTVNVEGLSYGNTDILLSGNTFKGAFDAPFVTCVGERTATFKNTDFLAGEGVTLRAKGNVRSL